MEEDLVLESETSRLSLVVYLLDEYSQGDAMGGIDVSIEGLEKKPLRKSDSYYIFLDIVPGNYTVRARPGRYGYYFDPEPQPAPVVTPIPDGPLVPSPITIHLMPRPSYPFPPGETLVRGILREMKDGKMQPVPAALLKLAGKKLESMTDEKGEFVIYFTGLKEDDLIRPKENDPIPDQGRTYVKGNQGIAGQETTFKFQVTHGGTNGSASMEKIEVGKTNSKDMIFSA